MVCTMNITTIEMIIKRSISGPCSEAELEVKGKSPHNANDTIVIPYMKPKKASLHALIEADPGIGKVILDPTLK